MCWETLLVAIVVSFSGCTSSAEDGNVSPKRPEPLCKPFSEYTIRRADLNKSVSPCNVYIHADVIVEYDNEKYFRVVVRRNNPIQFNRRGKPIAPQDQLRPYHYKWLVVDKEGEPIRNWLAYFHRNRDGNYHTIIRLPPEEWNASILEIYFDDVNGDKAREHVTYRLLVGDILKSDDSMK